MTGIVLMPAPVVEVHNLISPQTPLFFSPRLKTPPSTRSLNAEKRSKAFAITIIAIGVLTTASSVIVDEDTKPLPLCLFVGGLVLCALGALRYRANTQRKLSLLELQERKSFL